MRVRAFGYTLIFVTTVIMTACQTKPAPAPEEPAPVAKAEPAPQTEPQPAPAAPAPVEKSAFSVASTGFWPSPESRAKTIRFSLLFGNKSAVKSWAVQIDGEKGAVKRFPGTAAELPANLEWDGKGDTGELAPEGTYVATLSIEYGEAYPAISLKSERFILALSAPEPYLRCEPARFEPTPTGVKEPITFQMSAKEGLARVKLWSLEILGPDGPAFRSFQGNWPVTALAWDGTSTTGALVETAKRYTAVLTVWDEFGHAAATRLVIPVSALPYATERSSIRPLASGFSPNGDKSMDAMEFALSCGNRKDMTGWKVEIVHPERGAVRTWSGKAGDLPSSLAWDGKTDAGQLAEEGRYTALLSVEYDKIFAPELARSPSFVLDATPPELSIYTSPTYFSPDGDGIADKLLVKLSADSGLAKIVDYGIDIKFPDGALLTRFEGPWPAEDILWDGTGPGGKRVESIEEYPIVATVRDEFGNVGRAEAKAGTDIILLKESDRYRIVIAGIVFKSYTADFKDVEPDRAKRNDYTLGRLAAKLAKLEGYDIGLVGHAVKIHWDNPVLGDAEQAEILLPLSRSRAKAIADALIERGIDPKRLWTDGVGASQQLVPDSDFNNRWRNRRVEFFLTKPKE